MDKQHFKVFIFFALWLLAGLVPILLQIIPIDMTVADRFFYFAFAGLLGLLAVVFNRMTHHKSIFHLILILSLVLFSIKTMARNADWYSNITLYSHDLKIAESSAIYTNLGNEYMDLGRYADALKYYKKAVEISRDENTISNLGYAYEKLNDFKSAQNFYNESFRINRLPYSEHR